MSGVGGMCTMHDMSGMCEWCVVSVSVIYVVFIECMLGKWYGCNTLV